jgi:class 3 adenylate cyclase
MPAVLLAELREVATALPEAAAPPGFLGAPDVIMDQSVKSHGGAVAHAPGYGRLVFFEQPAGAVACALAMQTRLTEYNRKAGENGRVLMRFGIHAVAGAAQALGQYRISEREFKVASLILQSTPAGRIFLSREAHLRAKSAVACAFIHLGTEYFSGLPEPVDFYEAWRMPRP